MREALGSLRARACAQPDTRRERAWRRKARHDCNNGRAARGRKGGVHAVFVPDGPTERSFVRQVAFLGLAPASGTVPLTWRAVALGPRTKLGTYDEICLARALLTRRPPHFWLP